MTNPFTPHASNLFADRESVADALQYADKLIGTMDGMNKAAAWTALMVLVNTSAKLWPLVPADAPVAEVQAPGLTLADIDARIAAALNDWSSDSFDARADEWLNDHADLDHEIEPVIERWIENNLDVEAEIRDVLRDAKLTVDLG